MAGHTVPDEFVDMENPVEAADVSVSTGADLYAVNCAVCHGENGEGDGPGAAALDPPPANMHEDHVQGLTDGAIFYIVSHGVPETAMPPWDNQLSEEERWHLVNFLRTFE
jgi:mono/diheme cytochrome c family protein